MIATVFFLVSLINEDPEYLRIARDIARSLSTRDSEGYPLEGIDEVG